MKFVKLISTFLAVLMMISALSVLAGAEGTQDTEESGPVYTTNTGDGKTLMTDYLNSKYKGGVVDSIEEKLSLMDYRYGNDDYEIYVDAYSGEVAVRSKSTGETLFTNPYTLADSANATTASGVKEELLSQIIVNYTVITEGTPKSYNSYVWAAAREQILVKNIKGGIRVEYSIGVEDTRTLLPYIIEASAIEEIFDTIEANINAAIEEGRVDDGELHRLTKLRAYYTGPISLLDVYDTNGNIKDQARYDSYKQTEDYKILFDHYDATGDLSFAIYDIEDGRLLPNIIKQLESVIKEYCPDYTYEDLEEDHALTGYVPEMENYPLFKVALEYTLEEDGLKVKLPSNGIRFDESLYRLDNIEVLPYMGAGVNPNAGYTFFPDGSGALFDFRTIDSLGDRISIGGRVYGQDYAYHTISGRYYEAIRYPVFGIREEVPMVRELTDAEGNPILDAEGNVKTEEYIKDRGYVAIVQEGESLMELYTRHGGNNHEYNSFLRSATPI